MLYSHRADHQDMLYALAGASEAPGTGNFRLTNSTCSTPTRRALTVRGLVAHGILTEKGVKVRRAFVIELIGWTPDMTRRVENAQCETDSSAA